MKWLFFLIVIGYCLAYAPYGINETDGGFLTGLAWQVLHGKVLYADVVYVRPPLSVWLRAGELLMLPECRAVLGERWIFYGVLAMYSWLGATVLVERGKDRWWMAIFGFVVSVHCYPATAWHTTWGIFWAALSVWLLGRAQAPDQYSAKRTGGMFSFLAGVSMCAALLCKQSFYPMAAVFAALLFFKKNKLESAWGLAGLLLPAALWLAWLQHKGLWVNYFALTGGAATGGQAVQHGILDYAHIPLPLIAGSLLLLAPIAWWIWRQQGAKWALVGWSLWLLLLIGSYAWVVWQRQDFTPPFAQARLGLCVAAAYGVGEWRRGHFRAEFWALLALSWCTAISWGYALPILFAVPWVWVMGQISNRLWEAAGKDQKSSFQTGGLVPKTFNMYSPLVCKVLKVSLLILLLAIFRLGYEFVYRDGRRAAMRADMGSAFPQLAGIRSDTATLNLYLDLKALAMRYPHFKTLPAFPQANFLTKTRPPLPLDWVVNREMGGAEAQVQAALERARPVLFIEKNYAAQIDTNPELAFTRECLQRGILLMETPHFWVVQY